MVAFALDAPGVAVSKDGAAAAPVVARLAPQGLPAVVGVGILSVAQLHQLTVELDGFDGLLRVGDQTGITVDAAAVGEHGGQAGLTVVNFVSDDVGVHAAFGSGGVAVEGMNLAQVILEVGPGPLALLQQLHGVQGGAVSFLQGGHSIQHGQVDDHGEVLGEGNVGVQEVVMAINGSGPHPVSAFEDVGVIVQGLQNVLGQNSALRTIPHTGDFAAGVAGQHGQNQLGTDVLSVLHMLDLDVVLRQNGGLSGQAQLTVSLVGHGVGAGSGIDLVGIPASGPVGAVADDGGFFGGRHGDQGQNHHQSQQQSGKLLHGGIPPLHFKQCVSFRGWAKK